MQTQLAVQNKKVHDNAGNEIQVIKAVNTSKPRILDCGYNKRHQLIQTSVSEALVDDITQPPILINRLSNLQTLQH